MGDEGFEWELAVHRLFDHAWELGSAAHATECGAAPDTAGHQLEGARADLLAGTRHTNDHGLAPALMAALKRGAHHVYVADALEAEIYAAVGELYDHLLDGFGVIFGIDAVGGAQLRGEFEFVWVDVHADDARGAGFFGAHDDGEPDAAEAEDGYGVAGFDFGGVMDRANTRGYATAQKADFLERRLVVDLCQRNLRHHGVLAEGARAHVVVDGLSLIRESRGAVWHQAFSLCGANGLAEVGFAGFAELTLAAFGGVERDHAIALFEGGHALSHLYHYARAFVAEHGGEDAFWVLAAERERVSVADASMCDLDQDLAFLRRGYVNLYDLQGFSGFKGYSCATFHGAPWGSVRVWSIRCCGNDWDAKKARPSTLWAAGKRCSTETRGALLGLEGGAQVERLDSVQNFPWEQDRRLRKFDAIVISIGMSLFICGADMPRSRCYRGLSFGRYRGFTKWRRP